MCCNCKVPRTQISTLIEWIIRTNLEMCLKGANHTSNYTAIKQNQNKFTFTISVPKNPSRIKILNRWTEL